MLTSLGWRISRKKAGLSRWLMEHASNYLDSYNDFSYDFEVNGERFLVSALAPFGLRTVLDVGANVGGWAQIAADAFPQAAVHAFELSEGTRKVLKSNLEGVRFVVPDRALGSTAGFVEYKDYGELSTVNSIVATTFHDATTPFTLRSAQLVRGDDYLRQHGIEHVDLLKIDVEGAEMHVLRGFEDALRRGAIRVIQFEYGHANADAGPGHLMKDFYALLEGTGYAVGRLWSAGVQFSPFKYRFNNFDSGPNYVAVLKSESDLLRTLTSKV